MRFWDSSALVPLVLRQPASDAVRRLFKSDPQVLAWTLSDVEIRSSICRLLREGAVEAAVADEATAEFRTLWSRSLIIHTVDAVKERAKRLLGLHLLRAADALQLGAALVAAYDQPLGSEFVSLDVRLADAARREGFRVLP